MSGLIDGLKSKMKGERKPAKALAGLSSGSTLLNLACSGDPDVGFVQGCYVLVVGDSASGKTFLTLTCLAEASIDPRFKNHRFIYDAAENGALMDFKRFFGKGAAGRVEPPGYDVHHPPPSIYSTTIEEFYYHLDDAFQEGKPFIYVLDSMDALTSDEEQDKFQERKKAAAKGRDTSGSYGTAKAKANSSGIRQALHKLKETGSILIVISQTRDNIGFGSQYNPKTRSGGRALRFYAALEIWSSIKEKLKKTVNGKPRQVGIVAKLEVKKNRLTGKEWTVEVPIYWSSGLDDTGSMVNWLVEEGCWPDKKGLVEMKGWPAFKPASLEKLIRRIEEKGLEAKLREDVVEHWRWLEEQCQMERKPRYAQDG